MGRETGHRTSSLPVGVAAGAVGSGWEAATSWRTRAARPSRQLSDLDGGLSSAAARRGRTAAGVIVRGSAGKPRARPFLSASLASPLAPGAPYSPLPHGCLATRSFPRGQPSPRGLRFQNPTRPRLPGSLRPAPWSLLGRGSTAPAVRAAHGLSSSLPVVIPEKLVARLRCH